MRKFDYEIAGKGISKAITDYGNIMGERTRLNAALLSNAFRAKQNKIYKIQEEQRKEQKQANWMQNIQQRSDAAIGNEIRPFETPPQTQVRPGTSGPEAFTQKPKDWIYSMIQRKKPEDRTEKEKNFAKKYLGLSDKGPWAKSGVTNINRNKMLGNILTGQYKNLEGDVEKIDTREEAENFLENSGYINFKDDPEMMKALEFLTPSDLIPSRGKGLSRLSKDVAGYKDVVEKYGEIETDKLIKAVQKYQKQGKSFEEIEELMKAAKHDPKLILKYFK